MRLQLAQPVTIVIQMNSSHYRAQLVLTKTQELLKAPLPLVRMCQPDTTMMKLVKFWPKFRRNSVLQALSVLLEPYLLLIKAVPQASTLHNLVRQHALIAQLVTIAWEIQHTQFHAQPDTTVNNRLRTLLRVQSVNLVLLPNLKVRVNAQLALKVAIVPNQEPISQLVFAMLVIIVIQVQSFHKKTTVQPDLTVNKVHLRASSAHKVIIIQTLT